MAAAASTPCAALENAITSELKQDSLHKEKIIPGPRCVCVCGLASSTLSAVSGNQAGLSVQGWVHRPPAPQTKLHIHLQSPVQ